MPGFGFGFGIGRGGGATKPDGAPSNLILTVLSDTSIKLDWTIGSTNQDGHAIERSTDGINYTQIDTVLGATATYTDTGLTQATIYYYRVRAYKGSQYSAYCTAVFQLTLATAFAANTRRYLSDDLTKITKDGSDLVSAWENEEGGDILTPVSVSYPLWTSDGIKVRFADFKYSVLGKVFADVPIEVYVLCMQPNWNNNLKIFSCNSSDSVYVTQYSASPLLRAYAGFASGTFAMPLNEYHIIHLRARSGTDRIQIDTTLVGEGDMGANTMNALYLGGNATGANGVSGLVIREVAVRTVLSSDAERNGIIQYLTNRNLFFLNRITFDNSDITFDNSDVNFNG